MSRPKVREIHIGSVTVGNTALPVLIAGLCVIEDQEHTLSTARALQRMAEEGGFELVFKASYDKANRTSAGSYRGPGLEKGLEALAAVRRETGLSVLTDVHRERDIEAVAAVADCLRYPPSYAARPISSRPWLAPANRSTSKKASFLPPGISETLSRKSSRPATTG